MFSSVGCLSCGRWFLFCRLEQQVLIVEGQLCGEAGAALGNAGIRVEVLVLERPDLAHGAREAVAGMDEDFHRIELKTAAARQWNVPLLYDKWTRRNLGMEWLLRGRGVREVRRPARYTQKQRCGES
jgi:hypothetical protein